MGVVHRKAGIIVAIALALTAVALVYSMKTLSMNTDTTGMISPEVPFRRNDIAFKKAFPHLKDLIVIVIDGAEPERAGDAAARLGERLKGIKRLKTGKNGKIGKEGKRGAEIGKAGKKGAETEKIGETGEIGKVGKRGAEIGKTGLEKGGRLFKTVLIPGNTPFFRRNGFLFLAADDLSRLADRLSAAEPFLAALATDPTLRGFVKVLDSAISSKEATGSAELAALLGRMAEIARAERLGRPLNLSWQSLFGAAPKDFPGTRRFVLAQPVLDYESLKPAAAALAAIRRAGAELGLDARHGLRMRITGSPALDQEELESVELGGKTALLLSLILVSILLVLGLHSVRLVVMTTVTLLMGLIWTAAFAALAIGQLNLISVTFAVLFIGLGVDFGIHMSLRYREEAARGAEPSDVLCRAGVGVGGALTLSAVSAAAGFFAFLPTDYQGLAELGLIAGVGMFIALAANLTVLPALLALAPPRPQSVAPVEKTSVLANLAESRGRSILTGAFVLGILGAAAVPFLQFDFNPMNLKNPEAESVTVFLDLSRQPGGSLYTASVLADGPEAAKRISARLAALPDVKRAISLLSFVPAEQKRKLEIIGDMAIFLTPLLSALEEVPPLDAKARREVFDHLRVLLFATRGLGSLGESAALLNVELGKLSKGDAAIVGLERRLTAYLPGMLERLFAALSAKKVLLGDLPPDLRSRWVSKDGKMRVEVHPADDITGNRAMRRFAGAVQSVVPDATGVPIIVIEAGEAVVSAFREASLIALVLIAAILMIVLRRIVDIFLVLAPLLLAGVLTAAVMVLFGLQFNFANIIVLPLLLGLGVSSGIHLVLRQREEKESARVFASSTPGGVLFSGLTTIAAFGSLTLSGHRGMMSMGLLLAIAISITLIATLVVLPSLMALAASLSGKGKDRP
jgi:hypothetical protein